MLETLGLDFWLDNTYLYSVRCRYILNMESCPLVHKSVINELKFYLIFCKSYFYYKVVKCKCHHRECLLFKTTHYQAQVPFPVKKLQTVLQLDTPVCPKTNSHYLLNIANNTYRQLQINSYMHKLDDKRISPFVRINKRRDSLAAFKGLQSLVC